MPKAKKHDSILGATIEEIDLRDPLSEEEVIFLKESLAEYEVIFFLHNYLIVLSL